MCAQIMLTIVPVHMYPQCCPYLFLVPQVGPVQLRFDTWSPQNLGIFWFIIELITMCDVVGSCVCVSVFQAT